LFAGALFLIMKRRKVWAVLGATEGLGPATIKYLLSRNQAVITLTHDDPTRLCDSLKAFTHHHGFIDILINNFAYALIDGLEKVTITSLEDQVNKSVYETLDIIKQVIPYMNPYSEKQVISIPPKPCILRDSGEPVYDERAEAVEKYCSGLEQELLTLDGKITYLASKGSRSLWRE